MRTLLLFDGLGGTNERLLPLLRELYADPANSAFFQTVFSALDEVAAYLDPPMTADPPPDGATFRKWLARETGAPAGALANSLAAGLCVHVYQACQLQPARCREDDGAVASLGHSIGLLAAVLAGLRLRRMDEFLGVVTGCLRLVAVALARGQQHTEHLARQRTDEAARRYRASGRRGAGPGPMASLFGLPRDELRQLVAEFNRSGRSVSVSLANSPAAHVLSGPVAELLEFYFAHQTILRRPGVTWAFLNNTIPFHSPNLTPAARRIADDRRFVGELPGGDRLALPVYATDGPRNLQDAPDLVDEFVQQVLLRPIEWETVIRHAVTDAAVDRIVDYGPGAAARRFTKECLAGAGRRVRFAPVQQTFAAPTAGGQHAMSALSRSGRTA